MNRLSNLHKSTKYRLHKERYAHVALIIATLCLAGILIYFRMDTRTTFSTAHFAAALSIIIAMSVLLLALLADNWKLVANIDLSEKTLWEAKSKIDRETDERIRNMRDSQMDKEQAMYRLIEFGRISSGIFHDISSPLTSLAIELENSETWKNSPENEHIAKSLAKLKYLVSNAHKHVRLTDIEETFDVRTEIESVIDLLTAKARQAGVEIRMPNSKQIRLFGNKVLFCHIIANLISNAVDAYEGMSSSSPGGGKKIVRINAYANKSHIRIRVTDHGKGIPEGLTEKIFETFFTTKHESGCGIGLSSSKYSLEKYFGGRMTATSADGVTAFDIRIPKRKNLKP